MSLARRVIRLRCGVRHASSLSSHPPVRLAADAIKEWLEMQGYTLTSPSPSGGGDWSWTASIGLSGGDGTKNVYTKTCCKPLSQLYLGESRSLQALHFANGVRVPKVFHVDEVTREDLPCGKESFIILEHFEPRDRKPDMLEFGRALARTHLMEPLSIKAKDGKFGFDVDTQIGGPFDYVNQCNTWMDDWPTFFCQNRMGKVVSLSRDRDLLEMWSQVDAKTNGLRTLFEDGVEVRPSILHGDLWARNYWGMHDASVMLSEPASYYGHHEAEFGMAWCAGFTEDFWKGYRELIPEAPLFAKRQAVYESYHKICHWMWFRKSYKERVLNLLQGLL